MDDPWHEIGRVGCTGLIDSAGWKVDKQLEKNSTAVVIVVVVVNNNMHMNYFCYNSCVCIKLHTRSAHTLLH